MNRDKLRQITTLIILIGSIIAANYFGFRANSDTGDIANSNFDGSNFFFPASYVFATIWPVIYLGIAAYAIYQALPAQRENPRFRAAAPWINLNLLLNAFWTYVFGMEGFVATAVVLVGLVITAVLVYHRLEIGRATVEGFERWLWIPLSIYLAWLTVATVANTAIALIALNWDGFGISYETWGAIMLVVGGLLAYYLYRGLNRNWIIFLVYIYAYIGIVVRYAADSPLVVATAAIAAFALLLLFFFALRRGSQFGRLQAA
jgi:tryptophan-rich sensory protein